MEKEITWPIVIRVWWAYLWRSIIIVFFGTMIFGFLLGITLGFILGALGVGPELGKPIVYAISIGASIFLSILPIRSILGTEFNDFKLTVIEKPKQEQTINA